MKAASPTAAAAREGGLNGRHVLAMLVAFFGVVFAVNGYFLVSALRTHSGVVAVEPYVKGLRYNERIEAGERQSRLGWLDTIELTREGTAVLIVRDAEARPVSGLAFKGSIGRPSTSGHDRAVQFAEREAGRYVASVGALSGGTWVVAFEATHRDMGSEPVYRLRRRLWLNP